MCWFIEHPSLHIRTCGPLYVCWVHITLKRRITRVTVVKRSKGHFFKRNYGGEIKKEHWIFCCLLSWSNCDIEKKWQTNNTSMVLLSRKKYLWGFLYKCILYDLELIGIKMHIISCRTPRNRNFVSCKFFLVNLWIQYCRLQTKWVNHCNIWK